MAIKPVNDNVEVSDDAVCIFECMVQNLHHINIHDAGDTSAPTTVDGEVSIAFSKDGLNKPSTMGYQDDFEIDWKEFKTGASGRIEIWAKTGDGTTVKLEVSGFVEG